jgi:hypothetical protein
VPPLYKQCQPAADKFWRANGYTAPSDFGTLHMQPTRKVDHAELKLVSRSFGGCR